MFITRPILKKKQYFVLFCFIDNKQKTTYLNN